MATDSPSEPAAAVLRLLHSRPATLGAGRLLCVDGPSGAGKTSLAGRVATREPGATVLHLDDLYPGWDGLDRVGSILEGLLRPLADGSAASYRRWDWAAGRPGPRVTVPPAPLLVLEGVGSGAARVAPWRTLLVWVDAPVGVRHERGLARDGAAYAPHWERWAASERAWFARERTREAADVWVDGSGVSPVLDPERPGGR